MIVFAVLVAARRGKAVILDQLKDLLNKFWGRAWQVQDSWVMIVMRIQDTVPGFFEKAVYLHAPDGRFTHTQSCYPHSSIWLIDELKIISVLGAACDSILALAKPACGKRAAVEAKQTEKEQGHNEKSNASYPIHSGFKFTTRQLRLTNNGLECSNSDFVMVWNRNSDCTSLRKLLLHHDVATSSTHLNETMP